MGYKFFDHTADVLFEAEGKDLSELFEAAGLATEETQVDLKGIKQKIRKEIKLEKESVEMLLFDFLQELIFLKDAKLLLFSKIKVSVSEGKVNKLNAVLEGERIDPKKHELKVDVKAVTLHRFEVK
ncbi:MAG: archease, partial [Candidatus Aenigmarchaeota archaeon]|nr:archease [Candidatus Aenigmarchaeota archaeon]